MPKGGSKAFVVFASACLLLLCHGLLPNGAASAAPFTPPTDDTILEYLPEAGSGGLEARRQHAMLARDPRNLSLALSVARADIERARQAADPRWLGRADAALAPWPADAPRPPAEIMLLRAVILQSNHDFAGSLTALAYVIAHQPRLAQARLTRASIEQVRGDYPAALADCGQFAALSLGLAPDTCTAAIMSLTGHAPLALRALTLSLAQYPAEPATRLWALTLAAEIAARLDDPSTEQRWRQALEAGPTDPYLLAARSDWLLDHGRPAEVEESLAGYTRADPLLLRLALAEQALARPSLAGHVAELAARFEAAHRRGDTVHRREEARFRLALLQQPSQALVLARANWDVQREPADARILAEAAGAAGRPEVAAPVIAWMRANGVQDAALQTALQTPTMPIRSGQKS